MDCALTTFGCVEWESQLFRGVMRARCYPFISQRSASMPSTHRLAAPWLILWQYLVHTQYILVRTRNRLGMYWVHITNDAVVLLLCRILCWLFPSTLTALRRITSDERRKETREGSKGSWLEMKDESDLYEYVPVHRSTYLSPISTWSTYLVRTIFS